MRTLGLLACLFSCLGLVGCSHDVCDPYKGQTCIALEVTGGQGTTISSLHVVATGFELDSVDAPGNNGVVALPVSLAIVPPAGFGGEFSLDVTGLLASLPIDEVTVTGTVEAGKHTHVSAMLELLHGDDGGMDTPDMAMGDMARELALDSECQSHDEWPADMKAGANCGKRFAAPLLDPMIGNLTILEADQVKIARDPASGRLGVVANANGPDGFDETGLVVGSFVDTWPVAPIQAGYGGVSLGERQGTAPSIVMKGDTARLCFLDTSDAGNSLRYTEVDAMGNFGSPINLLDGMGSYGSVAATYLANGDFLCAYYNAAAKGVFSLTRSNGVWATMPSTVMNDLGAAPGLGVIGMSNVNGALAIVHQQVLDTNTTMPVFTRFTGSAWSPPQTLDLDQGSPSGIRGQDVHVAQYGATKAISYLDSGMNNTRILRIATESSTNDTPLYVDPPANLYGNDVSVHAIAYDSFGNLHVALISPGTSQGGTGNLYYLRQYPNGSNGTKWLVDVVDSAAGDGGNVSSIDFLMDPNDRPHIVYFSGDRGRVMYATRTDR